MVKAAIEVQTPKFIKDVEEELKKAPNGGPWMTGEKIAMCDFIIGKFYVDHLVNPNSPFTAGVAPMIEAAPAFKKYGEDFKAYVQPWLEKRQQGSPF